jgi:hypothetical protein
MISMLVVIPAIRIYDQYISKDEILTNLIIKSK